jgi:hypothetical protein
MGMHTCEPLRVHRAHHVPRVCARMYACRALTRRQWMLTRFPVHPREKHALICIPLSCEELSGPAFSPAHHPIRSCCPTAAHPSSSSTWSPSFCAWPCGMKLRHRHPQGHRRKHVTRFPATYSLSSLRCCRPYSPLRCCQHHCIQCGRGCRLPIYSLSSLGRCHGHVRVYDRDDVT